MKTLLILTLGILLGIVGPLIPSINGHECYGCLGTDFATPNGPCWNKDPPSVRTKTCEGRCRTHAVWEETHEGKKISIERTCTVEGTGGLPTGCLGYDQEDKYHIYCECDAPLCNNEPVDQIPTKRKGNRLKDGTIEKLPGEGDESTGDQSGGGSRGALGVLVGPSFGVLVMGLLLGVGGALLPLLLQ